MPQLWICALGQWAVKITVTRDSVCAGDDVEEHRHELRVADNLSVEKILTAIHRSLDLPLIEGGRATWVVSSKRPLSVLAQQWATAKMVPMMEPRLEELDWSRGVLRVHVSYLDQIDPDVAVNVLKRVRFSP